MIVFKDIEEKYKVNRQSVDIKIALLSLPLTAQEFLLTHVDSFKERHAYEISKICKPNRAIKVFTLRNMQKTLSSTIQNRGNGLHLHVSPKMSNGLSWLYAIGQSEYMKPTIQFNKRLAKILSGESQCRFRTNCKTECKDCTKEVYEEMRLNERQLRRQQTIAKLHNVEELEPRRKFYKKKVFTKKVKCRKQNPGNEFSIDYILDIQYL